jgi:hypothetical protein
MKGDTVPDVLPEFPDFDQLRRRAKELYRKASAGESVALAEITTVSDDLVLSSAQLAVARRYGFASWPRLKREVERKSMIHHGDVDGLRDLLARYPELAWEPVSSCFGNDSPLGYLGVARFHGLTDHNRSGEIAGLILGNGAPPDGVSGSPETPLITAASYGEVEMLRSLIVAGADLETTGSAVAGGTALAHALEFGNTEVVDVLVGAGAKVHDIVEAAGVGDLDGYLKPDTTIGLRAKALRVAAINERLDVIDQLLATGLSVDTDPETGAPNSSRTVLHDAAFAGKPASVRHLLALGADPNSLDPEYNATPFGWCHHRHLELAVFGEHLTGGHQAVEAILEPITDET